MFEDIIKENRRWNLSELLAIIHHDGGHYETEHGFHKATEDAIKIVIKERQESQNLKDGDFHLLFDNKEQAVKSFERLEKRHLKQEKLK